MEYELNELGMCCKTLIESWKLEMSKCLNNLEILEGETGGVSSIQGICCAKDLEHQVLWT